MRIVVLPPSLSPLLRESRDESGILVSAPPGTLYNFIEIVVGGPETTRAEGPSTATQEVAATSAIHGEEQPSL